MKKVYLALGLLGVVFFTIPTPSPNATAKENIKQDSVVIKMKDNLDYIREKLKQSKQELNNLINKK